MVYPVPHGGVVLVAWPPREAHRTRRSRSSRPYTLLHDPTGAAGRLRTCRDRRRAGSRGSATCSCVAAHRGGRGKFLMRCVMETWSRPPGELGTRDAHGLYASSASVRTGVRADPWSGSTPSWIDGRIGCRRLRRRNSGWDAAHALFGHAHAIPGSRSRTSVSPRTRTPRLRRTSATVLVRAMGSSRLTPSRTCAPPPESRHSRRRLDLVGPSRVPSARGASVDVAPTDVSA